MLNILTSGASIGIVEIGRPYELLSLDVGKGKDPHVANSLGIIRKLGPLS